jgi:hypothetical protein
MNNNGTWNKKSYNNKKERVCNYFYCKKEVTVELVT